MLQKEVLQSISLIASKIFRDIVAKLEQYGASEMRIYRNKREGEKMLGYPSKFKDEPLRKIGAK